MSPRDAIFAVCAIVVGGSGLWITAGYGQQARNFPQAMSAIILVCGVIILIGALKGEKGTASAAAAAPANADPGAVPDGPEGGPDTPYTSQIETAALERAGMLRGALPFGAVLAGWALVVSFGGGYLLPGFVAGMALMWIAGARTPLRVLVGAAAVVLFCFTMFYIVFQTRIPETPMVRTLVAPLRDLI